MSKKYVSVLKDSAATPGYRIIAPEDYVYTENGTKKVKKIDSKADKKVPATAGNLATLDSTGNLADSGKQTTDFMNALTTAYEASGSATKTVTKVTQAKTGAVTVTYSDIQSGTTSQKGLVQLEDSTSSTSTTKAATPNSVKSAYDLANGKYSKPSGGIPSSDMDSAVQASLGKADTAIQGVKLNGSTLTPSSAKVVDLGNLKTKQTAVSDPSASGTTITAIATISQDANGVITATKKTIQSASQSQDGVMSAADKTKLDGIATGAEVNQNAFSNVKVGDVTVAADAKTDTLTLAAGSNVTITPDATNDKITIAAKDTTYTADAGIRLDGTVFKHTNSVSGGTVGPTTDTAGATLSVPYVTYDSQGHVTASGTRTHNVGTASTSGAGIVQLQDSIDATTTKAATPNAVKKAIEALDVSSVGGSGKYISAISESDGKISATATTMDTTPTASSTNAVTSGGIKTALDGKLDRSNTSAVLIEPSQTTTSVYLILGQYSYSGYKNGSKIDAYSNVSATITIESRHSGCGTCVISSQVNNSVTPTESSPSIPENSYTGHIYVYGNKLDAARNSQAIKMYRKYTVNAETGIPTWTITLIVNCGDYNNFRIINILQRNGVQLKTGSIPTYAADASYYVTSANLSTLGTEIASAQYLDHSVTQTADNSSTGTGFEVLFSATADNTTRTEGAKKSNKLTFQPSTGTLTATNFSGPLTGNVTGNCSGSSGSCTGNAATASTLATARKLAVSLSNTSTNTTFNGSADVTNIKTTGTLAVGNGGTGMTTSTNVNAVVIGNSTTATNAMQTVRTGNGAFYATAQDAKPQFGTLPIAQGGTGATTRLNALKALTNESVGTNATYFLTITNSWGKGGYTSVAEAKSVLEISDISNRNIGSGTNCYGVLVAEITVSTGVETAEYLATFFVDTNFGIKNYVKEVIDVKFIFRNSASTGNYAVWYARAEHRMSHDSSQMPVYFAYKTDANKASIYILWSSDGSASSGTWRIKAQSLSKLGCTSVAYPGTTLSEKLTGFSPFDEVYMVKTAYRSATGTTSKPVYVDAYGAIQPCDQYAGGTAVTLNNASKAGSTASFYAPTAGGTANYVLIGAGTTSAPTWAEKAPKAVVTDYPAGFTSRLTSWGWGTLITGNDYTQMSSWKTTNGSQMAFAEQLVSGASDWSLSVQIDGKFYQNEGKYRVLDTSNVSVPTTVPTLAWNTESTLATIDGKNVKLKLPANPNTDTKQNITLATTTKAFITGVSTTPTGTAQALTGLADTGVYLTTTAGELNATQYKVNEHCTMKYNSTKSSLDFTFS